MSTQEHQTPPLPVGLTLDRGFALLRNHPRALLVPQLVLNIVPLVFALVLALIGYVGLGDIETRVERVRDSTVFGDSTLTTQEVPDFTSGQLTLLIVLGVLAFVVYLWFVIAATISVVRGADRALEGREHLKLRPAMRDGLRMTPKLFGLGIVFWILATLVLLAGVLIVVVVAAVAGAVAILAGLAVFVALVWLGVRFSLWPVVHLSEGIGFGSFGRTFRLTKGRFWSLFGVLLLVFIVIAVVSSVLSFVLSIAFDALASISDGVGIVAFIPYLIASTLLGLVFTAGFIAPIVVAYRTLSGRDNADLWRAAGAMGDGDGSTAPPAEPGVRRWDAAEAPLDGPATGWPSPRTGDDAGRPSGGTGPGGLPDAGTRSDAEERWGRDSGDPPKS